MLMHNGPLDLKGMFKKSIIKNPRWQTAAILKKTLNAISLQPFIHFDKIWYDNAH